MVQSRALTGRWLLGVNCRDVDRKSANGPIDGIVEEKFRGTMGDNGLGKLHCIGSPVKEGGRIRIGAEPYEVRQVSRMSAFKAV